MTRSESEDGYELTVLDGFGNELWKRSDLPSVSGASVASTSGADLAGPRAADAEFVRRPGPQRDRGGAAVRDGV